ncbi:helix-turn-helix domain-containing protein [bacterium]|nr:helix-turn-helix domain-containing protein [bacterium]
MQKVHKKHKTLAQFIVERREKLGFSQSDFAHRAGVEIEQIVAIEQGIDLFLPTTIRQKLALALKIDTKEIKKYENKVDLNLAKKDIMEEIRELILLNSNNPNFEINCPNCGAKLITRIAKLYDLEDNLILRPKARCSKCPFQLID